MHRVTVVAVVVVALVFVSSPSSARSSSKTQDDAIVKAGLLRITDLSPGWAESPNKASSQDPDLSKYGKKCARLQKAANALKKQRTAHGQSSDFKQGSTDQISNTISVYRTTAGTKKALSIFKKPALTDCFQAYFTDQLKASALAGVSYKTSVGRLSVPKVGNNAIGFEISVSASRSGVSFTFYIDEQLVQVGRSGLTFSFIGEGTSPMLENQDVVQSVVSRVRTAETTRS